MAEDPFRMLFRDKNLDAERIARIYDDYELYGEMSSIKLHHGGRFTSSPGREYVEGEEVFIDYVDGDVFCVRSLNYAITKLGYNGDEIMLYHFKNPESNLDIGLLPLGNDRDVLKLLSFIGKYNVIEVYIEHGMPSVGNIWGATSSVIIEEITDEPNNIVAVGKSHVIGRPKHTSYRRLLLEGVDDSVDDNREVMTETEGRTESEGRTEIEIEDLDANSSDETGEESEEGVETVNVQDDSFKENLEEGDMVNDVEVDMSNFTENFENEANLFQKGVEIDVGDLEINEEVLRINFDDYDSGEGSDQEENKRRMFLRQVRRSEEEKQKQEKLVKCPFYIGKKFSGREAVKEMVRKHAIETRRELKITKNDKERVRVVCMGNIPSYKEKTRGDKEREKGESSKVSKAKKGKTITSPTCPWILFVSNIGQDEEWLVKTFRGIHKCLQTRELKWCNSTFLSKQISDIVTTTPNISGKALQDQLQKKFELGVKRLTAYRAKDKAMKKLRGDYNDQYTLLRNYVMELKQRNPDTSVVIDVEVEPNVESVTRLFKRIYICLGPLKKGFKAIGRRLLGMDGTHMRGPYPGQVLTAVGVDSNNGIYPVAYAIVEAETRDSWTWFLTQLGNDLDLTISSNFTFISDRQKGIIPAVATVFPNAEHRYCLRHIHDNLKAVFKVGEAYKDLLWKCATRPTVQEFENVMDEIKESDLRIHDWLRAIPPRYWARSHFTGLAKCDILLNNICESFNIKLIEGRDRPILTCLEYIREYLMKRIVIVQGVIDKSDGPLTPTATHILETINKATSKYNVIFNGEDFYQVTSPYTGDQCVVDIKKKECSCRRWELNGFPCKHAIACMWDMSLHGMCDGIPEDWVDPVYRLDTWKKAYSFKVNPITGVATWPRSNCPSKLLPPNHHKQSGRPRKKRKKSVGETDTSSNVERGKLPRDGKTVTCSECKQRGHNKKTCNGQKEVHTTQTKKGASQKNKASTQERGQTSKKTSKKRNGSGVAVDATQGSQRLDAGVSVDATQGSQRSSVLDAGVGATQGSQRGQSSQPLSPRVQCKRFASSKWFSCSQGSIDMD